MNKRKIMMVALSLCMVAILAVGGSLAYLMDTDAQTNVFTVGNVLIDLKEDFDGDTDGDGEPDTPAKLIPTTGKNENGEVINAVKKDVWVENTGSEDAYIRLHIAIPQLLDDGDPSFDASKNVLHFNSIKEHLGKGNWNWGKKLATEADKFVSTGDEWNAYTYKDDNGIVYNVYVVTHESVVPAADTDKSSNDDHITGSAITQVYLDSKVTNEDITKLNKALGTNWNMLIIAEGAQAQGFDDAFTALNTAFGVPSSTNNPFSGYAE